MTEPTTSGAPSAPSLSTEPGASESLLLTPPASSTDLVLTPPAAVATVETAQVGAMVPMDAATAQSLADKAKAYVDAVVAMDPRAPEFALKVRDVSTMGDSEIRASSEVSNRMLDRPVRALQAAQGRGTEGEPSKRVANNLLDLRHTVESLDPSQIDRPVKKFFGKLPFGDKMRDYFDSYRSSQDHLNAIIQALKNGQDELRKDNAAIEREKVNLWTSMQRLHEYAVLASSIDKALEAKTDQIAATDLEKANALRSDMLFSVRQKHQDLLTQLAVSAQGYLALDMVRRNNGELIKGVERATTTTVAALRTAIIVAQALANQKLVLDQITALNQTTSSLIVSTSEMLGRQSAEIHQQAATTTVSLDALKTAFSNIYATMDAVDTYRVKALDSMAATVTTLETEIVRSKDYLERARSREVESGPSLPQINP